MAKKKFFSKLLLSFMMVALIPILLLGFLSMRISLGITRNQLERQISAAATRAGETLTLTFKDFQDRLYLFCKDPEVMAILSSPRSGEPEKKQIYQKIFLLLAGKSSQYEMHVVSSGMSLEVSTATLPAMYNPQEFASWGLLRAMQKESLPILYPNRYTTRDGKKIVASIGQAIRTEKGTIIGYAIIDIPYQSIKKILDAVATELPMAYSILDEQQYLLYDDLEIGSGLPFVQLSNRSKVPGKAESGYLQEFKGKQYLISSVPFAQDKLLMLAAVPMDLVFKSNDFIAIIAIFMAGIALLLCLVFSYLLARNISSTISRIVTTMGEAEQGNLKTRTNIVRDDELGDLATGLNTMIENLDELFQENLEKQDRLRIAEIKHLQAQINPHFLYNTLESIKYLAKLKMTDEIDTMISRLGILLKSSINSEGGIETVRETMIIIQSYLELQQICYPEKFEFLIEIPPDMYSCILPKLIIQPIVENAIIHGMGNKIGKCTLQIRGRMYPDSILFEIIDDGIGMEESMVSSLLSTNTDPLEKENPGIGLKNIHQRIRLYYGDDYGLEIESKKIKGTTVRVTLPLERCP